MSWTVLQTGTPLANNGSATSLALTFANNLTAGSVIFVGGCMGGGNSTSLSVSDNAAGGSNVYTPIFNVTDGGTSFQMSLFSAPLVNGAGTKPTVTFSTSASIAGLAMQIIEVGGILTTTDKTASNAGSVASNAPITGTTGVTTAANEFCLAIYGNDGYNNTTITPGSGWTGAGSDNPSGTEEIAMMYKDSGASGSAISGNWSNSGTNIYAAGVAVFKLDATPIPVNPFIPQRMPLGV